MRRLIPAFQWASACALTCAIAFGAPTQSEAASELIASAGKGAGPGQTVVASGGAAQVQNGGPAIETAPVAIREYPEPPMTTEEVLGIDVPEALPGTSARRVDKPQDFGLRGGAFDRPVTLDFNEQDLANVIRLISSKGRVNIIFDPADVSGSVTLHWENVPLGVALEQILKAYGLGYVREEGDILRILPSSQLGQREIELSTEVVVLNWVKAEDLVTTLQPFVSQDGQIQANTESNSIVINDTPPNIAIIRGLVMELDSPEKQVLIEMHLVDLGESFSKQHGVNWDLFPVEEGLAPTGNTINIPGGVIPDPANPGSFIPDPLNPARTVQEMAKSLVRKQNAFASPLGALGDSAGFDAGLGNASSALSVGDDVSIFGQQYWLGVDVQADAIQDYAQVLANPRVITLNNLEAKIRIEEQIPYVQQTTTSSVTGTTTQIEFQDAGQEVTITPTITANGYVRMQIVVDQKIFRRREGTGRLDPPVIDEREAITTAIVENGKKLVLGGLEGHRTLDRRQGTPWLMDTPVFRWFFQSKQADITKTTLYLFVKPEIIAVNQSSLKEQEKFWYDGIDRNWDMPNQFFDNWPEHWGKEQGT